MTRALCDRLEQSHRSELPTIPGRQPTRGLAGGESDRADASHRVDQDLRGAKHNAAHIQTPAARRAGFISVAGDLSKPCWIGVGDDAGTGLVMPQLRDEVAPACPHPTGLNHTPYKLRTPTPCGEPRVPMIGPEEPPALPEATA